MCLFPSSFISYSNYFLTNKQLPFCFLSMSIMFIFPFVYLFVVLFILKLIWIFFSICWFICCWLVHGFVHNIFIDVLSYIFIYSFSDYLIASFFNCWLIYFCIYVFIVLFALIFLSLCISNSFYPGKPTLLLIPLPTEKPPLPPQLHCVKSVRIRSYSGQHFPAFGLNAGRSSECGISPNTGKCGPE